MPRFAPFRAVRYVPGTDLDAVLAPPYDVLSEEDVAALKARDRFNIAFLDDPRGDDRYDMAGALLRTWIDYGVLVREGEPSFTIYRMSFTDATGAARTISGVLGGLEVVDPDAGGVLPHERTTPKAVTDRLDLTRATRANLSPVWGLSLADGLTAALAAPGEHVGTLVVDGVEHRVERVADPDRIAAIAAVIGSDDVLIADGHHRYSIARTYRDEQRGPSGDAGEAELTLAFVNELIAEQLSIEAIHRLYSGLPHGRLRAELARSFDLSEAPAATPSVLGEMVERGALVLLNPDGSVEWLTPKPSAFEGVRGIDGAYLEHALADVPVEVSYQHGLDEMVARVKGEGLSGVLTRPTSLDEIRRTAREGLLMPPKSTFFTPKLRTGFVIREM